MWKIKGKDNQVKAIPSTKPEYNGEWMSESYVTVTVESPAPVNFEIGDYIIYRDERFEINYDPGKIKSAPRYEKGDAFKYENIKFNSLADELTRCDFLDIVLNDNQLHFTGLPKFSFYGGVKDLANRMQANLDRTYGKGTWSVVVSPEFQSAKEVNISVDTIKVQGALSILVNDLETYYTIKDRTITIGAAGIPAGHLFKYGKGNGLYEIEQNAEADQAIVTRLRAYGSTRNLPHRYYNKVGTWGIKDMPIKNVYVVSDEKEQTTTVHFILPYNVSLTREEAKVKIRGKEYVVKSDYSQNYYIKTPFEGALSVYDVFESICKEDDLVQFVSGFSSIDIPEEYKDYNKPSGEHSPYLPDNMAVQYLMLPEFPYTTQDPYIDSPNIAKLGVREGTVFFDGSGELEEIYPSIEGITAEQLKAAGVPCNSTGALDEIVSAEQIADNGVGEVDGNEPKPADGKNTFKITLKDLGFDINDHLSTETATISFKTGMLGGRDFEIVENGCKAIKDNAGQTTGYELELNRVYDDALQLWFPYSAYNAQAGDKFVLLYIEMPEVYIKAAAQRLKEAATEWLSKNDYSRSIYAPKVDEIFMARQHDLAMASGGKIKSLHDTLKEGMLLLFEDEDLNIDASIFIDRLTIKEEGAVPTYEVVLKEEKTVGRLDKMQNQIDSLVAGKGQGGGGYTAAQIRSLIAAYGAELFLSRLEDDVAAGRIAFRNRITFEDMARFLDSATFDGVTGHKGGARFGEFLRGMAGAIIDAGGNAEVESVTVRSFMKVMELIYNRLNALEGDFSFSDSGTIEALTDNGDGTYMAAMRRRWEGDFTSFQPGDVVYGYVNRMDSTGEHYRAWARVGRVFREANALELLPYADAQVPSGQNFPMTQGMIIARWGNEIPATADTRKEYPSFILDRGGGTYYNTRQSLFLISAEDGNIRQLMGVDAPVLRPGCFATVLGRIPQGLLDEKTEELINRDQPYLYARGIVVQDIIRINYRGVVQRQANYRGVWSAATAASDTEGYASTETSYDTVTHNGALWQCRIDGTQEEPSATTTAWLAMTAEEGTHIEYRYTVVKEGTVPKVIVITSAITGEQGRNPIGNWSTTPPEVAEGMALWRIQADINPDNTRASDWTDPVRLSGYPGKDGAPGIDGRNGLMAYPAGEYDRNKTYTSNSETTPVVLYNEHYYVLRPGKTYCGMMEASNGRPATMDPASDIAYSQSQYGLEPRWQLFDQFNSIFANILMADFAKLGSAVFYGDWMISQQGTLTEADNTVILNSTAYERFKDGAFEPNFAVNFASGEMRAGAGVFSGTLSTRFKPLAESDVEGGNGSFSLRNDLKLMFNNFDGRINLPVTPRYVGERVMLCDYRSAVYLPGSTAGVRIVAENGNSLIYGGRANGETSALYACSSLTFRSGIVELIAIPDDPTIIYGQQSKIGKCRWYILTAQADYINYTKIGESV